MTSSSTIRLYFGTSSISKIMFVCLFILGHSDDQEGYLPSVTSWLFANVVFGIHKLQAVILTT